MKRFFIVFSMALFLFSGLSVFSTIESHAASGKYSSSSNISKKSSNFSKKYKKKMKKSRKNNRGNITSRGGPQKNVKKFVKEEFFDVGDGTISSPSQSKMIGAPVTKTITGIASWYGDKFHRRTTASGERFDMFAMTGAIKDRRMLGKYVRVTNTHNQRSVIVKINDYGPHVKGRVIDLSYGSAKRLGMLEKGLAKVKIEVLNMEA